MNHLTQKKLHGAKRLETNLNITVGEGFSHKSEKREKAGDGSLVKIVEIIKEKDHIANKIEISSNAINVRTFSSDDRDVSVKLIGAVEPQTKVDLKVENNSGIMKIDLNTPGQRSEVRNLYLIIGIPSDAYRIIRVNSQFAKVDFSAKCEIDFLEIKTKSGEVSVRNVNAEGITIVTNTGEIEVEEWNTINTLVANSKKGSIYCQANASYINCNTDSGDIELSVEAKKDMEIDLNSKVGNIETNFSNLDRLIADYESECGDAENNFMEDNGEYIVNLNATSYEGDVVIENK